MKIAFDHHIFNAQAYGGISRYYTILAQELLKLEQEVKIFAGVHRNHYLSTLADGVVSGVKFDKYGLTNNRFFRASHHYAVNLQINNWRPNIVHETYYSCRPSPAVNSVHITTVHDMTHEIYPQKFTDGGSTSELKRKTLDRVEHIISVSHNTKKDLIELFGINERKISVVHLGVDLSFSNYTGGLESKVQRPFLIYVGNRGGHKNFNGVLQAMASSKPLKTDFDLIAFGGGEFSAVENSLISSLGFRHNQIRQIGGGDDVLKTLYHQAVAFIYPSLYEGFGLPPLEAMACSCPVISSNTSSMPEVIGNAGEYFEPSDVDAMRVAIENVVYSPTRIQELQQLGLNRVKLFNWSKCAAETLEIYKKIIG